MTYVLQQEKMRGTQLLCQSSGVHAILRIALTHQASYCAYRYENQHSNIFISVIELLYGSVSTVQVTLFLMRYCWIIMFLVLSFLLLSRNVKIRIYKTIILPVVLYGCETLSLTLREEHRFEGI
jgi:hypothetical protein